MSTTPEDQTEINPADEKIFDAELITKYPRSNRRVAVDVAPYGISPEISSPFATKSKEKPTPTTGPRKADASAPKGTTVHLSPHGIQFRSGCHFDSGTLLKIHISIPDYWARKQRFVDYGRVDSPGTFKILAKVISSEDIGKRGKRKMVLAKTVSMDEVDEKVLKAFLQEG